MIENQRATEYFLNSLEKNIISERTVTVTSTDYYDAGTEAIQHSFALLDNISDSKQNNLQMFADKLANKILFVRLISVSISLLAVYSYIKFV